MSWQIGVHIEECFIEVCAVDSETQRKEYNRWFMPRQTTLDPIRRWAAALGADNANWLLTTSRPKIYCEKGLGNPPIILAQQPYEEVLLQQSKYRRDRTRRPHWHTKAFPLQRDHIFPIAPDASIDDAFMQMLVGKVQLLDQRDVVLLKGLQRESADTFAELREYLTRHQLKIFSSPALPSANHPETLGNPEAKIDAHWWRCILDAFAYTAIQEIFTAWDSLAEPKGTLRVLNESLQTFAVGQWHFTFSCSFAHYQTIATQFPKQNVLICGLEEWAIINTGVQVASSELPIGRVAVDTVAHVACSLQPTCEISPSAWGPPQIRTLEVGYEPGPISMGKGLKPTLLDLLTQHNSWPKILPGLHLPEGPKIKQRWKESILSLSPYSRKRGESYTAIEQGLFAQVKDSLYSDLARFVLPGEETVLIGPLAPLLHKLLTENGQTKKQNFPLRVIEDSGWCMSETLVSKFAHILPKDVERSV